MIARKTIIITIGTLLVLGGLTAAIALIRGPQPADKTPVLIVTARGGMCPEGECTHTSSTVYSDGAYDNHKRLSAEQIRNIRRLIHDLSLMTPSGNGTCQSYVDGTDTVWRLPGSDQDIIPCTYTDQPSLALISELEAILQ